MEANGELCGLKASEIKKKVEAMMFGQDVIDVSANDMPDNFKVRYDRFANSRPAEGTRTLYKRTWDQIERYAKKEKFNLDNLTFEQINVDWLREFDLFLEKTSPSRNARNIHFRNIRAVFNDALEDEIIECYPFRRFKLRYDETPKRALGVDKIREVFNLQVDEWEQRHLDCFKLIFLFCGINIVDLYGLGDIVDGRIEYYRAKTHRFYSIKVEPEAMELIERWKGEKNLLCYSDTTKDYRIFYNRLALALKERGLSTYIARHSWATIARKIGVSKDDIKLALGHGQKTVTDIYIDEDREKIDEANRKVIDWVLYGKK